MMSTAIKQVGQIVFRMTGLTLKQVAVGSAAIALTECVVGGVTKKVCNKFGDKIDAFVDNVKTAKKTADEVINIDIDEDELFVQGIA